MPKEETKKTKSYLVIVNRDLWHNFKLCMPRDVETINDMLVILIQDFVDKELRTNKKKRARIENDNENGIYGLLRSIENRLILLEGKDKPKDDDEKDSIEREQKRLEFLKRNDIPLDMLDINALRKLLPNSESMSKKEILEILND